MEMPESWLECKRYLDPNYCRSEEVLNEAIDFMKEMAEFIDEYSHEPYKDSDLISYVHTFTKRAKFLNQKFKEWK